MLEYLEQLAAACRPGGNLAAHDGVLVYLAGTGGPLSFDLAPAAAAAPPRPPLLLRDHPLHLEELVAALAAVLPGRPKVRGGGDPAAAIRWVSILAAALPGRLKAGVASSSRVAGPAKQQGAAYR
jgi:hypothetical protein